MNKFWSAIAWMMIPPAFVAINATIIFSPFYFFFPATTVPLLIVTGLLSLGGLMMAPFIMPRVATYPSEECSSASAESNSDAENDVKVEMKLNNPYNHSLLQSSESQRRSRTASFNLDIFDDANADIHQDIDENIKENEDETTASFAHTHA